MVAAATTAAAKGSTKAFQDGLNAHAQISRRKEPDTFSLYRELACNAKLKFVGGTDLMVADT